MEVSICCSGWTTRYGSSPFYLRVTSLFQSHSKYIHFPRNTTQHTHTHTHTNANSNFYSFTVLAVDKPDTHLTQRTGSATIYITVLNFHTTPPIFLNTPYSFNITEKSQVGTYVGAVMAVDGDAGLSTEVSHCNKPMHCCEQH